MLSAEKYGEEPDIIHLTSMSGGLPGLSVVTEKIVNYGKVRYEATVTLGVHGLMEILECQFYAFFLE